MNSKKIGRGRKIEYDDPAPLNKKKGQDKYPALFLTKTIRCSLVRAYAGSHFIAAAESCNSRAVIRSVGGSLSLGIGKPAGDGAAGHITGIHHGSQRRKAAPSPVFP